MASLSLRLLSAILLLFFTCPDPSSSWAADRSAPPDARVMPSQKQRVLTLLRLFGRLIDEGEFEAAARVARLARQIDPEDPGADAAVLITRMRRSGPWKDAPNRPDRYE